MNNRIYSCSNLQASCFDACKQLLQLFLLAAFVCFGAKAETTDGLYTGDNASKFADILLSSPSAATKQYLRMETLWEMDMSKAYNGQAAYDAYENNHNLFVIGDKVYTYVETYQPASICVRCFDSATKNFSSLAIDIPEGFTGSGIHRMMFSDNDGHFVLIGFTENGAPNVPLKILVNIYDSNLVLLKKQTYSSTDTDGLKSDHILQYFEWLGLSGNVLDGDFTLTLGGWHNYRDSDSTRDSYASLCTLSFTNDSDKPQVNVIRYASGEYYSFETRRYDSLSSKKLEGRLFSTTIDNGVHLVQGFGTKSSPYIHSPILLYKDSGESTINSSSSTYPLYNQIDALDNEEFVIDLENDKFCFGIFPVSLANERLLVLPYKFNSADGVKFKLARWTDISSFDNLTELWQFPNNNQVFYPTSEIYDFTRPKVVVVPAKETVAEDGSLAEEGGESGSKEGPGTDDGQEVSTAEATVYAYMPGALLGAYKISLIEAPVASGVVVASDFMGQPITYTLEGRTLRLSSVGNDVDIEIYSTSGARIYSAKVMDSEEVNLDGLPAGICIMTLDGEPHKIVLK